MVIYGHLRAPPLVHQTSCYCQILAREEENVPPLVRQKPSQIFASSMSLKRWQKMIVMLGATHGVLLPKMAKWLCSKPSFGNGIAKMAQNQWRYCKATALHGARCSLIMSGLITVHDIWQPQLWFQYFKILLYRTGNLRTETRGFCLLFKLLTTSSFFFSSCRYSFRFWVILYWPQYFGTVPNLSICRAKLQ